MRIAALSAILFAGLALAGCNTSGESMSFGQGVNDLGSSISGGVGRDTSGTSRRPDMLGSATAPSLPSIGAPGFGK